MFKVYGFGRVASDIELVGEGNVARLTVATDRYNGKETVTDFFYAVAFGKLAERVNKALVKGQGIVFEGNLNMNNFTDKEGNKRSNMQLVMTNFEFAGPRPKNAEGAAPAPTATAPAPAAAAPANDGFMAVPEMDDEELPFN